MKRILRNLHTKGLLILLVTVCFSRCTLWEKEEVEALWPPKIEGEVSNQEWYEQNTEKDI